MLAIISVPESPSADQGLPRLGEKAEIFGAVDPRARSLPERGRFDQLMLAGFHSRQQPVRPFGLLGRAPDHAANQEELRIVTAMQFGIDSFHATAPGDKTTQACLRRK